MCISPLFSIAHMHIHIKFHKHNCFFVHNVYLICYYSHYLVIEAQLVPHDTSKTNEIVFPNDAIATMFSGAQIKIPRNALIHQRESKGEDVLFLPNFSFFISRHGSTGSKFCCKKFTVIQWSFNKVLYFNSVTCKLVIILCTEHWQIKKKLHFVVRLIEIDEQDTLIMKIIYYIVGINKKYWNKKWWYYSITQGENPYIGMYFINC